MINPHIVRKTTSPVAAPPEAGIHWINTVSNTSYFSVGTASVNDWVPTQGADSLKVEVKNITGVTIPVGSAVYINGASGNLPTIALARANLEATSAATFGLTVAAIANNATGEVITSGKLSNMNTSGFTEGVQLYLSPSVAGGLTTTKPTAPNHLVSVAICTRAHPTLGVFIVSIKDGFELTELADVAITSVADGQLIKYESATSLWKNVTPNYAFNDGDLSLTNEYKITNNSNGEYPLTLFNQSPDFISGLICIDDTESKSLIVGLIGSNGSVSAPLDVGDAYIATANDIVFDTGANIYFTEISNEVASITTGGVFTAIKIDPLPIAILDAPADTNADKRSSILYTDYTTSLNKKTKLEELPISDAVASRFNNTPTPLYISPSFSAIHAGTVTETIITSFLVPANTLSVYDIVNFKTIAFKETSATVSKTWRIKVNSANTLVGAGTLGQFTATGTLTRTFNRKFIIGGGNIYSVNTATNSDVTSIAAAWLTQPFNVTVNNYFFITAQLAVATPDTMQILALQVDQK